MTTPEYKRLATTLEHRTNALRYAYQVLDAEIINAIESTMPDDVLHEYVEKVKQARCAVSQACSTLDDAIFYLWKKGELDHVAISNG